MPNANKVATQCEDVLASVLGLAMHFLKTISFNHNDPQQLYSVCLYTRLVEIASGCKALLEKDSLVGIPILLRSMYEADIDLTNLMKCRDYSKDMYASFLKEKLRLTKEVASFKPNPFLTAVKASRNPAEDLKETQDEFDRLVAQKHGRIDIRCRAELAGKINEHLSVYNMLCLDTHNNIRSLEDWHLEVTDSNNYHVVAFKQTKADLVHYLSAVPGIILLQTKALADFLGTSGIG
ncbi:MAG: DUF5677 domain-containing protein, partial [Gammaproteobacteria bacterium]